MSLTKHSLPLNFSKGLDTKTDPFQVAPGNFLALTNTVFTTGGQLKKRNGFPQLTSPPPNSNVTSLTTWSSGLIALGDSLYSYNADSSQWQNKGPIKPVSLSVLPLVRTAYSNSAVDSTVAPNGLVCTVFLDGDGNYKYQIDDSASGETIVSVTALPSTATQARVFVLGAYFVITFLATVSASPHLRYIAIPTSNPINPATAKDISTSVASLTAGYDGYVSNNTLFIAWAGADGGGAIRVAYLNAILVQSSTVVFTGHTASLMSVTADNTMGSPIVWVSAYSSTDTYTWALSSVLNAILSAKHTITSETLVAITSTAQNGVLSLFYEVSNSYGFSGGARSDLINTITCTQGGTLGTETLVLRSVGLGSKAFLFNGLNYMMAAYGGTSSNISLEPTYFLIDQTGTAIARFASANGAGYASTQVLASVTLDGSNALIGYLYKDLIQAISTTNTTSQAGFYSQTGVNLINFNLSEVPQNTAETGGILCITGGFLWMYDGNAPVEQGFHVFPEAMTAVPSTSAGSMTAQQYFYQFTYEWTDGTGVIHRSTPSIPIGAVLGGTGEVALNIPTLRLTAKIGVRIVIYRWSAGQQTYYQVTSVTSPLLNDKTVDYVTYTDTVADSGILGNNIIYTAGGVIGNLPGPACDTLALFDNRLWLIYSEDRNLLGFSKQVIEATTVEMSDLLTLYVAPSTGAQGSTGNLQVIFPMDDKLILFKADALAYVNGTGPDNTGSNNQYSQPIFITSTIGSSNPKSVVFSPQGLFFDSDQGRWILGRDLSTNYVGAPVAAFNDIPAVGTVNVPEQNQIRITLPSTTLVYNYFYGQWGTFTGIPAISSTLYRGEHTFLNQFGQVFQELDGSYVDGSQPVLMSFTTAWFNLAGLQGFQRAYFFFLLGQYISPHRLAISVAYDYNPSPQQSLVITPINYAPAYGSDAAYGASTPYGGPGSMEWWRVFFGQGKCTAFQISLQEQFDYTLGTIPGAGFTLSGLNLIYGAKDSYPRLPAVQSAS